eukprot:g32462.t1
MEKATRPRSKWRGPGHSRRELEKWQSVLATQASDVQSARLRGKTTCDKHIAKVNRFLDAIAPGGDPENGAVGAPADVKSIMSMLAEDAVLNVNGYMDIPLNEGAMNLPADTPDDKLCAQEFVRTSEVTFTNQNSQSAVGLFQLVFQSRCPSDPKAHSYLLVFSTDCCVQKKRIAFPAHSELGKERECCYIFSKCHALNKISAQKFAKQQSKNEFHRIADCCVQKKRIAFPLILSWENSGNAVTSSRNVMLLIKSLHKSLQNSSPKTSFIELLSFFHRLLCTEKKNSIPAHSELGKERECCYIFSKCHVLNKISAQKFAKQQSKNEFHRIADCCVQKKRIAFPLILSWGKSGNAVTSSRNVMLLIKSLHKSLIIKLPFFHTFKFQTGPRKFLRLKALTGSYVFGIQLILLVCQRVVSLSDSGMSTKHIAKTLQAILKNSRGELFLKINGAKAI